MEERKPRVIFEPMEEHLSKARAISGRTVNEAADMTPQQIQAHIDKLKSMCAFRVLQLGSGSASLDVRELYCSLAALKLLEEVKILSGEAFQAEHPTP